MMKYINLQFKLQDLTDYDTTNTVIPGFKECLLDDQCMINDKQHGIKTNFQFFRNMYILLSL